MENVQSITGLDYLNTDSVTNMAAMFMGSASLTSLDLSHFNTTMVTDMFNMFYECSNLASLDVSGFNTAKVRDMRGMFRSCSKLTTLDLSSFNTANVENVSMMFSGDAQLVTIYAGDGWSLPEGIYVYSMFDGCASLVGGQGTSYDPNHVDGEYAHIDGGPSDPGYFTAASSGTAAGDVNGDTTVNIADVTALIDLLLGGGTPPAAADVNGDGDVNISDVTALIDYLLSGT
jgi:surface protein